jgi:transcription elongation factor GreA
LKEVKKNLEARIRKLERELQDELPKALKKALEHGDLRENSEYQSAKERQSFVQAELRQLKERLGKLSMVNLDKIPHDRVSYGSTVVLFDLDREEEFTYRLVMAEEADVPKGLISTTSPIGKSLLGKEEGDEVQIVTPRGRRTCEIVKLSTIYDREDSAGS